MGSYRIGGLAVALGIGSAVLAGHGVAAAAPSDGSTDSGSTKSTSSGVDNDAPASAQATTTDPVKTATEPSSDTPSGETVGTATEVDADELGADDEDAEPGKKKGSKLAASLSHNAAADPARSVRIADAPGDAPSDHAKLTTVDSTEAQGALVGPTTDGAPVTASEPAVVAVATARAVTEPQQPTATTPAATSQDPVELATVAISKAVSALFSPLADDAPATPAESAAMWTLAAAARRELTAAPDSQPAADPVTNSLTTPAAGAEPAFVAIPQTAPLEWLQQLPVVGAVVVTPIVTVLHMIPIVSDVLHPFVGFPVQWGLPAGAPVSRDVKVISDDGTPIYVHFMPARGLLAGQKASTVLNGPGLTLPGATNIDGTFLDDVTLDATGLMSVGVLRNAGYNVVTWDPRGEWNSGGQLELNSADFEGHDMSAIISYIAAQPESLNDAPGDPRLGMTGVSYGGGIQLVTAAIDHRVDAIVPAITYNRLDNVLYTNDAFRSSWATLLVAALDLTGARVNPRIQPAAIYGDLTGMMSQADLDLLKSRNPDIGAIRVPTLLIQGTADTIFSTAQADATAQTLIANGVPTKVVWFCGGHGFCANNPIDLRDGALIKERTLAWLDRYVKGDKNTETGPQFEWVDQRGQWYSSNTYPVKPGSSIVTSAGAEQTLPLIPYVGGSGFPVVPFALQAPVAVNLHVPQATSTTYLVGAPQLSFSYSGTGTSRHVYAQLVDDRTGLVLSSLVTPIPVTLDGQTHTLSIPLEPVAHTLRPGESVTLQLVGSAGLYERVTPSVGTLNVSDLQLTLPTADPNAVTLTAVTLTTQAA